MADIAIMVDRNAERRRAFALAARRQVARFPELEVQHLECGDLMVVWGAGRTAPVSYHTAPLEGQGRSRDEGKTGRDEGNKSRSLVGDMGGVLIGYALTEEGEWLHAPTLIREWSQREGRPTAGPTFDGYFVGVVWNRERGLTVGVDPLGLFPLYFTQSRGTLVAGSTPAICALHPDVAPAVDPSGLVGILLTNGLVGNQSLLRGVRRLSVGHHLCGTVESGWTERTAWAWERDLSLARLPFNEALGRVDQELSLVVERHRPGDAKPTVLLSGGCDSRIVAGYARELDCADTAVTFGYATDLDRQAASQVARTLEMRHYLPDREADAAAYLDGARQAVQCEQLSAGFSNLGKDFNARSVGAVARWFLSGYAADEILGGYAARYARDPSIDQWTFEQFATRCHRWGMSPDVLSRIWRSEEGESLSRQVMQSLRGEWEAADESLPQRSIRMKLATRVRYYIGSAVHRTSFRSWPVLPIMDRRVLRLLYNLNPDHLLQRKLEYALLSQRFPALASIPLDSNSFRFEPIAGGTGGARAGLARLWSDARRNWQKWYWTRWRRIEPRRYHRLFDLSTPQWRAVRSAADERRERLHHWFRPDGLDEVLPRADHDTQSDLPFSREAAARILMGLCLWREPESLAVSRAA